MGGSSSQTIGQRYFAKLTTFIGNPIEKLIGINFDNRGWIFKPDNDETFLRVESPNLYGDKEGGVAGFIDIHTGTADQLPNATYSADFPKVSGYPFQSYLLFRGLGKGVSSGGVVGEIAGIIAKRHHYNKSFYHGNSGYMKEMLLWPKRIHIRNDGRPQWHDEKAEIPKVNKEYFSKDYALQFDSYYMTDNNGSTNAKTVRYRPAESNYLISDQSSYSTTEGEIDENVPDKILKINVSIPNRMLIVHEFDLIIRSMDFQILFYVEPIVYEKNLTHVDSTGAKHYRVKIILLVDNNDCGFSVKVSGRLPNSTSGLWMHGYSLQDHDVYVIEKFTTYLESGDINPIHKIREILTDDTAMNKPESEVNDLNFKKAADVLFQEKLGISWSVTEKSCLEAINELCGHIEAGVRMNRQTGLYEMVLFRDDWFDEDEIHTLPVNKIKSMNLDGATSADELINKLNVSYYNQSAIKDSSFSIAENAAIRNLKGHENADDVKFPYFMNQRNAAVVAQWKLKQMSTPVWQGTFTTGFYDARKWNRYDLLRLAWPRKWSGTILVRIMKINLGTGTEVSIDFVEVVPYSSDLSSSIVIDTPVDTTPKPPQPAIFKAFELSYLEAVQLNGQKAVDETLAYNPDAGYAAVIAKRPQPNSLNALMYTDIGNNYERASAIVYSETAELDQNISRVDTTFILKNAGDIDMVSTGTQITVNNEIMVYQSYEEDTGVITVKRGALDTIPLNHLAGSVLYFADDFVAVDPTEYVRGEVINVKAVTTTPSGILDLTEVDAQQVQMQARAIRPYPPADVKINGKYWPSYFDDDFTLMWSDRNRLQQTGGSLLGYYELGVLLEPNTQTLLILIELDESDIELVTHNVNVTGTSTFTLLESTMDPATRSLRVNLKTTRDSLDCLYGFEHIVRRTNLVAPSNVQFEVIEI